MYLSKKYLIPSLSKRCRDVLQHTLFETHINVVAVLTILEQAALLDENDLRLKCWDLVDNETQIFSSSEAFNEITLETLNELLGRETLTNDELEVFQTVFRWSGKQCLKNGLDPTGENRRRMLGYAIYNIRFLVMSREDFFQHVSTSGLLTTEECVGILQRFDGTRGSNLKWTTHAPRQRAGLLSFTRFDFRDSEEEILWGHGQEVDIIVFTVNKPVRFHGVQLFGDANGSDYDVVFNMDGAEKFQGRFRSHLREDGISTFNVFLPEPVHIEANKKIRIWAEIRGSESLLSMDGKNSVQCNDIVMRFFDLDADDPLWKIYSIFPLGMAFWGPFYKILVTPA
jgi:BTB/POZ domain-containing protein 3/6